MVLLEKGLLAARPIDYVEQRRLTGKVEKMVSNLVVNPEISEDSFKPEVPEGYGMTTGE